MPLLEHNHDVVFTSKLRTLAIALIASFFYLAPALAQHDKIRAEIDKLLYYDVEWDQEYAPGFLLAIVDGDSSWVFSYGKSLHPHKDTLSSADLFNIGGIGLVELAKEIIESDIQLDTKIKNINTTWGNYPIGEVTIASILNHSAGFSKIPKGIGRDQSDPAQPYKDWSKEDAHSYYRSLSPQSFNKGWNYSYHGYALLADLLFKSCGTQEKKHPTPGLTKGKEISEISNWGYLRNILSHKKSMNEMIALSRELMPLMSSRSSVNTEHKHIKHNGIMYHSTHAKKYEVYTHAGRTDGHYVHLGLVPSTKTAVIIMANGEVGLNDLGILTLRMINGNWKRIKS